MVKITIDNITTDVPPGTTIFTAARQLQIDLPVFCYQDRMPPFGACRVCLVEVEKMGKLQTSCSLEAVEGMVVHTQSKMATDGRNDILEFLLINHPLDCPVCDRGGECPLQEHTMECGPGSSRFYEEKRHFKKPIALGPVLMLDRERCISCARCTRFGDIVAGDHALEFIDRGYKTEVGTPNGAAPESKFIGNTIMICPVGALTSQVYRFRARPWDNDTAPSTCTLCPVGCSLMLDSRDGEIVRTRAQENRDVNDIWLCDKGWFGYEFTDHEGRLQHPLVRRNGKLENASWDEALDLVAEKILEAKAGGKIAAFGGNPLTLEENFLFQRLYRSLGVNNLDHRIGMPIFEDEGLPAGMETPIGECEALSSIIILGLDITEEFPVIWLRLKQAINKGAKVHFYGHFAPEVANHLTSVELHTPGKELEIIERLPKAEAVFVGRQYLSMPNRKEILSHLVKLNMKLNIMEGEGNSLGARLAGMRPDFGGLNALQVLQTGDWDFLHVAGANPAAKFPAKLWKGANVKFLVVQDLFMTETACQADVVLPTLAYVEKEGSFINIEGRVQSLKPGKSIPEGVYSDGKIFELLAQKLFLSHFMEGKFKTLPTERKISGEAVKRSVPEGKLVVTFAKALFDNGVRMQHNPHVKHLAKEPRVRINPATAAQLALSSGDVVLLNGTINGKVKLDEKVAENTVVVPLDLALTENPLNGQAIDVKKDLENRFLLM